MRVAPAARGRLDRSTWSASRSAALKQPFDCLRLKLTGEPPSGLLLHHPALLGRSGSTSPVRQSALNIDPRSASNREPTHGVGGCRQSIGGTRGSRSAHTRLTQRRARGSCGILAGCARQPKSHRFQLRGMPSSGDSVVRRRRRRGVYRSPSLGWTPPDFRRGRLIGDFEMPLPLTSTIKGIFI
jgi:hypothetical protein